MARTSGSARTSATLPRRCERPPPSSGARRRTVVAGSHIYRSRPDRARPTSPTSKTRSPGSRRRSRADRLLDELLAVEAEFGRVRDVRLGPRTLDLDLIWLRGARCATTRGSTLPHPRAHEREFVLRPLAELDPDLVLRGDDAWPEWLARLEPQGVEPTGVALM